MNRSNFKLLQNHIKRVNWETLSQASIQEIINLISIEKFVAALSMSAIEIEEMRREFEKVRSILYDVWENTDTEGYVSDDGLSDLVAHVIGLGLDEVQNAIDDPDTLVERA